DRPELLIDITLPQGSSINATRKVVDDLEATLKTDPDIEHWSFYVGSGAIRFYLPLDQQLTNDFFAQAVVVTKGFKARAGVQQQFFPSSDRPELLIDLTLPQGSSINATRKVVDDLEKILKTDPDIEHWSFYVGSGAIRFYLPLHQQLANDFFAQGVIVTKGFKVRPGVHERILAALQRPEFEQVQPRVSPLELGPPVGWPLKFRISGPEPMKVREIAQNFASLLGKTPHARNINYDWNEPSKVVRVEVDQDRARSLGISSQALSQTINAFLSGTTVTQLRDDIYLIDIVARAIPDKRAKLETLRSLMINVSGGRSVPLEQVAKLLRDRAAADLAPPSSANRHGSGRHQAGP
ncbi:MAG TPA: efflux RND transporter permease subunit, partial [Burkholderiaceae bacterium]|nr:efflux RND transporter permease subunit [Burkholderiaceae bacterium]